MAQINVQGPSDDEEFDTTSNVATLSPPEAEETAPVNNPEPAGEPLETPAAQPSQPAEAPKGPEPSVPETPTPPPAKPAAGPAKPHAPIWRLALETVLAVAVIVLALWAWSLHSDNKDLKKQVTALNNNPEIVAQRQKDELIHKAGALVQLPTNAGTPIMYTVSDITKAKALSDFFVNAQNGDQVLFYQTGFAVVYRPSTNKVVNEGTLVVKNAQTTTAPASTNKR